jgi:hypothetical protein
MSDRGKGMVRIRTDWRSGQDGEDAPVAFVGLGEVELDEQVVRNWLRLVEDAPSLTNDGRLGRRVVAWPTSTRIGLLLARTRQKHLQLS